MDLGWRKLLTIVVSSLLLLTVGVEIIAANFGGVRITLQSRRYFRRWDMTRFVYRVRSPKDNIPDYWVLGTGGCITDDQIDWWSSSWFTWVDEPIEGLRFEVDGRNVRFELWLHGKWDVGPVDVAVVFGGGWDGGWNGDWDQGPSEIYLGTIDGPVCTVSSIALDIVSGASVEFPKILRAGVFSSLTDTQLLVSGTSAGWELDYTLTFFIPDNAQQAIVERIFQVAMEPHGSQAGATEITVSYSLNITDEDFAGLPEGMYVIGITYTVTAGN